MTADTGSVREPIEVEQLNVSPTWFIILGILLAILGLVAIGTPVAVGVALNIFLGIILIIGGASQGIQAITSLRWKGFLLHLLVAAIYLVTGVLLLTYPLGGVLTLTLLLALYLIASGVFRILASFFLRPNQGWVLLLLAGLVNLILGALIWSKWPSDADWFIGLLIGIDLLLTGISMIMIGIAAKTVKTMPAV